MSAIDTSTSLQAQSQQGGGFSSLSTEEFTEIILTELANQDPLEPNDTQALLEQLSAIRSIESETKLTDSLDALVERDEFATAATLIGREVRGLDQLGLEAAGPVRSVSNGSDGVRVNLEDGRTLEFGSITEVLDVASGNEDDEAAEDGPEDGENEGDLP